MFAVSTAALGGFVLLGGHVDHRAPDFQGFGRRAFTDRQLAPLGKTEIRNLNTKEKKGLIRRMAEGQGRFWKVEDKE